MNEKPFTSQIRRRALREDVIGYLWMVVISAGLVPWGLYFLLGRCDDCTGLNVGGIIIGLGMEAGAAWLAWHMVSSVRARIAPGGDPLSAQLRSYGSPATLGVQLDSDFAGRTMGNSRYYLSKRWLVLVSSGVQVVRLEDLVWAYMETVQRKLNGIIPIGTTHQLAVWERSGRGVALVLGKGEVEGALMAVAEAAPWTLLGYSDEFKESWNNDREDMLAFVERRQTGG